MDGKRFDELTRFLAHGTPRRSVLKALVGGTLGGGLAARWHDDAEAACKKYNRPCSGGDKCCGGASCLDGRCQCGAGVQACAPKPGKTKCVPPCPPDQSLSADCRCLCNIDGRPPIDELCCTPEGEIPEDRPCCEGLEVGYDGTCTEAYNGGCIDPRFCEIDEDCCDNCCIKGSCSDPVDCIG